MGPRLGRTALLPMLLVATLGVCGTTPTEGGGDPVFPDVDLTVLFIGNSLTYTNDLPAMLQTVAEAAGHTFAYRSIARPNFSLEDHWYAGVGASIEGIRADVVVMQQGPSSLQANQAHLREWALRLEPVIRGAGGTPALYMVWPDDTRTAFFDDVRQAYEGAADATGGIFAPAGVAWQEVWAREPSLSLYGPDGFHPSRLGSAVAALTLFRVLFDEPVDGLPSRMEPTSEGLPVIDLGSDATVVLEAVEAAVASGGGG